MRLAIAGVPRAGKTTRARGMGEFRSTDDVIDMGWSEASAHVAGWFNEPGALVVEGVAVPRALRKWLAANPRGRPVDVVEWMGSPRVELSKGQSSMAKGCEKVFREIEPELRRRGVRIHRLEG